MRITTLLLGTTAFAFLAGSAFAQDAAPTAVAPKKHHRLHNVTATENERLELLEKEVQQEAQEIQDLKAQMKANQQAAQSSPPPQPEVTASQFEALQNQVYETQASVKSATAKQAAVHFNHAHLTVSSPDGKYTFSPMVDVMGDWASYSKGQPLSVAGTSNLKSSGENLRRAQIGFQGVFAGDFGYRFLYDFGGTNGDETYQAYAGANSLTTTNNGGKNITPFTASTGAGSGPHVKEAWISYKGILNPFTFKIGAMPTPANLSDMTSSDDLLFNERPSPAQLSRGLDADDGRESVGFIGNGNWWQGSLFLTGDTYGKGALIAPATTYGGGQEAFVGRAAIAPWYNPDTNFNIHLGGNFGYVVHPQEATSTANPGVTTYGISFSDRPELRVDNVSLLNTGSLNARNAYSAGVEAAISYGPLLLEGENFWYGVHRNNPAAGVTDPTFSGWYLEGSWVVTGEPHKYNMASAAYTRPSPADPFDPMAGSWGAWELAGRYSSTSLDYHMGSAVAADRIFGGDQNIWSAGLNFYPNDTLKFMLDYQDVMLRNIGALGNNGNYNTISFRTQVTF